MLKINYSISELSTIIRGELIANNQADEFITDILIDSRKLVTSANCIFFALKSKTNDGHKYIDGLYNLGIRNFVVSQTPENLKEFAEGNFILVKDSLRSLQLLANSHRNKFNIPIVGITGSN